MKVIDLLNKIANGEEVPRKFTYKGYLWEYDVKNKMWFYYFGESKCHRFDRLFYLNMILNDEVEIIEKKEETKPTTKEIEALGYACGEIQKCFTNGWKKSLKNESLIEEDKKIEELEKYYDDDLEEYIVETYINGVNYKEIFKSKYDEMMINKINEIIDKINEDK